MITRVKARLQDNHDNMLSLCHYEIRYINKILAQQITYHECKKTFHSMHNKMFKITQASSTYSLS